MVTTKGEKTSHAADVGGFEGLDRVPGQVLLKRWHLLNSNSKSPDGIQPAEAFLRLPPKGLLLSRRFLVLKGMVPLSCCHIQTPLSGFWDPHQNTSSPSLPERPCGQAHLLPLFCTISCCPTTLWWGRELLPLCAPRLPAATCQLGPRLMPLPLQPPFHMPHCFSSRAGLRIKWDSVQDIWKWNIWNCTRRSEVLK